MKTCNGHKSYNYWNVALWIANDYGLYQFALDCLRGRTIVAAADAFIDGVGASKTPDGVPYLKTYVRAGLSGLRS